MQKTSINKIREIIIRENKFILDLFAAVALPAKVQFEDEEQVSGKLSKPISETLRATSLSELQNRLEKVKVHNASYKEKLQKKHLKNKVKKKLSKQFDKTRTKRNKENVIKQSSQIIKGSVNPLVVKSEPMFNQDNKLVFSKIDFTGFGKHKQKKGESNPKRVLGKVQDLKDKISKLKLSGETEMAAKIAERAAWKNALAKSQGEKVKDDPVLLKKSIKKLEQKKKSSKKKWESRQSVVEKMKKDRQLKREENIEKRKKEKKIKKLKVASKRGKIIPGF